MSFITGETRIMGADQAWLKIWKDEPIVFLIKNSETAGGNAALRIDKETDDKGTKKNHTQICSIL